MVFRYRGTRYPVQQFRREMDRLLSGFVGNVSDGGWPLTGRRQVPVNVWEDSEAVSVEMELPGVKSDEIEVSVVGTELSLKVNRPEDQEDDVTYHRRERGTGSFARVLRLPSEVDADNVEADLTGGILTVRLPKQAAARPKKIKVAAGG